MSTEKNIRIRQKVDTRANFVNNNTKLLKNEIAIENDSRRIRLAKWNDYENYEDTMILYDPGDEYVTWTGSGYTTSDSAGGPINSLTLEGLRTKHNFIGFMNPNYITVEYSLDGGETWLDKGCSDGQKIQLTAYTPLSTMGPIYQGDFTSYQPVKSPNDRACTIKDLLRITLNLGDAGFYFIGRKIAIKLTGTYMKCYCNVEVRTSSGAWETLVKDWCVSGWPNWNIADRYFNIGSETKSGWYNRMRFTFYRKTDAELTSSANGASGVYAIQLFGDVNYTWKTNTTNNVYLQYPNYGTVMPYDEAGSVRAPANLQVMNELRANTINNCYNNTQTITCKAPWNFSSTATIGGTTIAKITDLPSAATATPQEISNTSSSVGTSSAYAREDHTHRLPDRIETGEAIFDGGVSASSMTTQVTYTGQVVTSSVFGDGNDLRLRGGLQYNVRLLTDEGCKAYYNDKEIATVDDISSAAENLETAINNISTFDANSELFRFTNSQPSVLRLCQPEDQYKQQAATVTCTNWNTDTETYSSFTIENLAKQIGFPEEYKAYYKTITIASIEDSFNSFFESTNREITVDEFFGNIDITMSGYTVFGITGTVKLYLTGEKATGDVLFYELPLNIPNAMKPGTSAITQFPGTIRANQIQCDNITDSFGYSCVLIQPYYVQLKWNSAYNDGCTTSTNLYHTGILSGNFSNTNNLKIKVRCLNDSSGSFQESIINFNETVDIGASYNFYIQVSPQTETMCAVYIATPRSASSDTRYFEFTFIPTSNIIS